MTPRLLRPARYFRLALVVWALLVLVPASAPGAPGDQLLKLAPSDGVDWDGFGQSVDIDQSTVVVGADSKNEHGEKSGAVYWFDVATGSQLGKIAPVDGQLEDRFGFDVAIRGNSILVGAPFDDDNGVDSGMAYLIDAATGSERFRLTAEDGAPDDSFGWSVDVSEDTAIVGAPKAGDGGAAYLFDLSTGAQLHKLTADDAAARDFFGGSVALRGTTAIIGASGDDGRAENSGAAYLFDTVTGQQLFKLSADDGSFGNELGTSVDIHGDRAIAGATFASGKVAGLAGAAYLFDVTTGEQLRKLTADDGEAEDLFGWSVGLSSTKAIVGAYFDDDLGNDAGAAYLFDLRNGRQLSKLTAQDGEYQDWTGRSVAITDQRAIVGSPYGVENEVISGVAHVFDVLDLPPTLQAGDADQDLDFDQLDLVRVQIFDKYLSGQPATWGQGDWNGAPGGTPGDPPAGDGLFNQLDIVASQIAGLYLTGPYAGLRPSDASSGEGTAIGYDAETGALWVEPPDGARLTSINIDSASGIFTGEPADDLGGSFDNDADNNIFKATFGSSFGSLQLGSVAKAGLSEQFLLDDLTVIGSREGGGALGEVSLVYVPIPEPSTLALLCLALVTWSARRRRT